MFAGRPSRKTWAILGILVAVAGLLPALLRFATYPDEAGFAADDEWKQTKPDSEAAARTSPDRQGDIATTRLEAAPPVQTGSKASFFKELAQYAAANGQAAVPLLKGYLDHPDWEVRCAALRALGATGSEEAVALLRDYVSEERSLEEAAQAALALADLPDPRTTEFLAGKYRTVTNPELKACLLETLAARPFGETQGFFQAHLASPAIDAESKAAALRMLGFHRSAPTDLLVSFLTSRDSMLRAAAYDAWASRSGEANGRKIAANLATETDTDARRSLYHALSAQTDLLPVEVQNLARAENDTASRIRAHKAWAAAVARSADATSVRQFTELAIPELTEQALSNSDPGEQRAALQALAASKTEAAAQALAEISATSPSPRLRAIAAELSRAMAPTTPRR